MTGEITSCLTFDLEDEIDFPLIEESQYRAAFSGSPTSHVIVS
jgi:hypothetical protein